MESSIKNLLKKPIEDYHCDANRLISCGKTHAFAKAAHDAFYGHHPLIIRPDDIWFCIVQGFSEHVKQNSEQLRSHFVEYKGKKELTIVRPDFKLGDSNPWPEVFASFSSQIHQQIGKVCDVLVPHFSTTTALETAAFEIGLMDTFQEYFEYGIETGCGIPEIILLGTPDDWADMITRVHHLSEYGMESWTSVLLPILDKIYQSSKGNADTDFWQSFFRYRSSSGFSELTGWIQTLFPYIVDDTVSRRMKWNPFMADWNAYPDDFKEDGSADNGLVASRETGMFMSVLSRVPRGPSIGVLPTSLVSAPVSYTDFPEKKIYSLSFIAGQFGVQQEPLEGALSAVFGWAVVYD